MKPFLSVVIPAYNEAERLPRTLDRVLGYLAGRGFTWEVTVVDDGSTDGTGTVAAVPGVRVVRHERNFGKGRAVKTGMLSSTGEWRLFMDADGSSDVSLFDRLWGERGEAQVVIGSRVAPGSNVLVRQPLFRKSVGTISRIFMHAVGVLPEIHDTQCGFKLFSERAVLSVFPKVETDGWANDIEVLVLMKRAGFEIREVPLEWSDDDRSKFHWYSYLGMIRELIAVRIRLWSGRYR